MRYLFMTLLAAALFPAAHAASDPLAEHRWRHRLLLLYVPGADTPALAAFRERLRDRQCAVDDRDLVTGEVIGTDTGSLAGRPLDAQRARALRRQHGIAPERVTTVLVGKDGGVKMRVEGIADLDAVFQRIDGMPMRRREMAERGPDGCSRGDRM